MKEWHLKRMVLTALMAAMTMVATMSIKIPSPTGGYIHPGDSIVILSGIVLGPVYGSLAAGIGSMFADIFSGYAGFAIATLVIKGLAALLSSFIYYQICKRSTKSVVRTISVIVGGLFASVVVTGGYFVFEAYFLGLGVLPAAAGIGYNLIQNGFGIAISVFLLPVLLRVPVVKEFMVRIV